MKPYTLPRIFTVKEYRIDTSAIRECFAQLFGRGLYEVDIVPSTEGHFDIRLAVFLNATDRKDWSPLVEMTDRFTAALPGELFGDEKLAEECTDGTIRLEGEEGELCSAVFITTREIEEVLEDA